MSGTSTAESQVWTTAWKLGRQFATASPVRHVGEVFGRSQRADDDRRPFEVALADARSRLALYDAQPLLLAHHLPYDPAWELIIGDSASGQFLEAGKMVASALVAVIEWQRAALPDYPRIPVLRTDSRAPRVVDEGFPDVRMPWPLNFRQLGLQLQNDPPSLAFLGVNDTDATMALQRELRAALTTTGIWQQLHAARGALTDQDRDELRERRKLFRHRAADEVIERVVGGNLLQRRAYLHALVHEMEHDATGRVGGFYRAFGQVDEMIDDAAAVVSWAATIGQLLRPVAAAGDWWPRSEGWRVRLRGDSEMIVPPLRTPFEVRGPKRLRGVALVTDAEIDFRAWPVARWGIRGRLLGSSSELADEVD